LKDFNKENTAVEHMVNAGNAFCNILTGKITAVTTVTTSPFPNFIEICKLFKELRTKLFKYDIEKCEHYIQSFVELIQAWTLERVFKSYKINESIYLKDAYFGIREYSVGLRPFVELQAMLMGIVVPDAIRRDPLLLLYKQQAAKQVTLVNDLFSFNKEVENDEFYNYMKILAKEKPVDVCYRKGIKMIIKCMDYLGLLEKSILLRYPEEENVKEFLLVFKAWIDGHMQWCLITDRYGEWENFEIHAVN